MNGSTQQTEGPARGAAAALDQLDAGVVVLSSDRKVIHANASANEIIAVRDGLAMDEEDRLVCTDPESADQLARLHLRGTGFMQISRGAEVPPHHVRMVPLHLEHGGLVDPGAAVVYLRTPGRVPTVPFSAELVNRAFSLTPTESKMAVAIARGHSVRAAAQHLGIAESTGRTLLKRVLSKTGVSRQAQLVHLMFTHWAGFPILRGDVDPMAEADDGAAE